MACNCGHDHHISKEDFDKAVQKFLSSLNSEIDLDAEYEKIQNKTSELSRMQRDTVIAIVEYKREHFSNENNCSI